MSLAQVGIEVQALRAAQAKSDIAAVRGAVVGLTDAQSKLTDAQGRSVSAQDKLTNATKSVAQSFSTTLAPANAFRMQEKELAAEAARVVAGFGKQQTATKGVGQSLVVAQREAALYKTEMDRIRAQFDPLFAASQRYETQLQEIAAAERAGAISAGVAAQARQRAAASMAPMVAGVDRASAATSKFGMVANQVGYQIQDVFVSGPMVGYFRAIAQQAPQAAGAFAMLGGTMGTVIPWIGTFIAVGAAVAPMLFNMGEKTKAFEDRLSDLQGSLAQLKEAANFYGNDGLDNILEKYGTLNESTQRHVGLLREAYAVMAQMEAVNLTSGLVDNISGSIFTTDVDKVRILFDTTNDGARDLIRSMDSIASARGIDSQILATERLRDDIIDATGGVNKMTLEQVGFYVEVVRTIDALKLTKVQMDGIASTNPSAPIEAAANAAGGLANNLASAFSYAQALSAVQAAQDKGGFAPELGRFSQPSPFLFPSENAPESSPRPGARPASMMGDVVTVGNFNPVKATGGGGGKSDAQKAAEKFSKDMDRDATRFYESSRTSAEEFAEQLDVLNTLRDKNKLTEDQYAAALSNTKSELLGVNNNAEMLTRSMAALDGLYKSGAISADEYAAAVKRARDEYGQLTPAAKSGADAISGIFDGALQGTDALMDAIGNLLLEIAKVQLMNAFMGTGFGQSAAGTLGSLLLPSFDGGGHTGTGSRTGGVDGKGGRPAIVHPNEIITDLTKGQSVPGVTKPSSYAPIFNIDARGAQAGVGEQIAQALAQYDQHMPDRIAQIDSTNGRRF